MVSNRTQKILVKYKIKQKNVNKLKTELKTLLLGCVLYTKAEAY